MAKAKDKGKQKGKGAGAGSGGPVIDNRRARFNYEILDTLETGIMLRGSEVKSIRDGKASIAEGFVRVEPEGRRKKNTLWLYQVNIAEYAPSGKPGSHAQHRPTRSRKLLAHQREIDKLAGAVATKGMTLIPLKMYFKGGLLKVLIGLARGKAAHDKRNTISKRDAQRDIDRAMSRRV